MEIRDSTQEAMDSTLLIVDPVDLATDSIQDLAVIKTLDPTAVMDLSSEVGIQTLDLDLMVEIQILDLDSMAAIQDPAQALMVDIHHLDLDSILGIAVSTLDIHQALDLAMVIHLLDLVSMVDIQLLDPDLMDIHPVDHTVDMAHLSDLNPSLKIMEVLSDFHHNDSIIHTSFHRVTFHVKTMKCIHCSLYYF